MYCDPLDEKQYSTNAEQSSAFFQFLDIFLNYLFNKDALLYAVSSKKLSFCMMVSAPY
jgi:hypothetical protein